MGLLPEGLTALVNRWLWPLRRARRADDEADWQVVERLWQLYSHDLSEFRGTTPAPDGCFGRGHLASYSPDDSDDVAYLAGSGDRPVGFALVRGVEHDAAVMGEFFVVRSARRAGVARAFAEHVVRAHPGRWEIAFQDDNVRAARFWRRLGAEVLADATEERRGRSRTSRTSRPTLAHGYGARMRLELPAGVLEMRDRGDDWAALGRPAAAPGVRPPRASGS